MTLTQEALGRRLREARENIRLTQRAAAEHLKLDQSALAKIEKGSRSVTSTELVTLARLYGRDMTELLSSAPLEEDPFTILGRITEGETPQRHLLVVLALERLKEAVRLEGFLRGAQRPHPPTYQFNAPSDSHEAIDQGKEAATRERRRLDLGGDAIPDVAELIASQGIWTAAIPLPHHTSGLFVAHARYGMAVFVNQDHRRAQRRFSCAHEYAHALLDRARSAELTTVENAKTLIEKRANAFASEFLMPAEGVGEALDRMNKGGASRASAWMYDIFTQGYTHDEMRQDAAAQRISFCDVAFLAHEFRVSYEMAAVRLKDLNFIRKPALDSLLSAVNDGNEFMRELQLHDADDDESQPYLVRQLIGLAMEAFRLDKISRGRFVEACALAGQEPERLLSLAMRAKKE